MLKALYALHYWFCKHLS